MDYKEHPEYRGHEKVVFVNDAVSGLRAIIAIHSTALGPAAGGCRIWSYANEFDALSDALRLSHGMTLKNAAAGLDLGGGKAVIMLEKGQHKTEAMLQAFGRAIDELGGKYFTAEDVGATTADMEVVHTQTSYVAGLARGRFASGDPSPLTARGVFGGMKVACAKILGVQSLKGTRIAVEGIGNVGWQLCELLHQEGARLAVTDVDKQKCARAADRFGAAIGELGEVYAADCEVYAPCALGGTLTAEAIPRIKAKIVAGAANNQLRTEDDAQRLQDAGITYVPDFLLNAGGILNVAAEIAKVESKGWVDSQIEALVERVRIVLDQSVERHASPNLVALQLAEARLEAVGAEPLT